ncbi:HIR complex subunit [Actinomortierella ambigua]|uniref:Protein HIR n=1 Tax=Actinomortierella ambigua TaxID=1343610 RepID=A0A9P6QER2_9FUNG|nr:HIR complex subunit [Actinomortierella ambigua]
MQIIKPDWVCHLQEKSKKAPIYSLHVHPDGTRLATGAQDAKVKIWSLAPILDADKEQDPDAKRHLCTMSLHNGAVLCVKWSNGDGNYLASGSDDQIVMIWQLDRTSEAWGGSAFGSSDGPNVENWRAVRRLSGHESDVSEVAWSPENTYLASASLDSKIIIWDGKTFDKVMKLDQHQGFVKGLTWDPVGKYLASQSDDKSVRIWRVTDWEVEVEITAPYAQSSGTTFFRRLSWSPDGGHIATANAVSSSIPVAAVIGRDNWKADISLVGHAAPIEVVAFNPLLFKYTEPEEGTPSFTSIVAVGSQDRGLSVWRTHEARPFVAIKDLFDHSSQDLSWTPNGQALFACSYDGTVAVLLFQSENLGEAVSPEERQRLLAKYGYERRNLIMAETPLQLALEEKLMEGATPARKSRMEEIMQEDSSMEGITTSFATPSDPSVFASSQQQAASAAAITTDQSSPMAKPVVTHMSASDQSVTITSDGKKRIKPLFLGSSMGNIISRPAPTAQHNIPRVVHDGAASGPVIERSQPSTNIPEGGFPTVVVGVKRKEAPTNGAGGSGVANKKLMETNASNRSKVASGGIAGGGSGGGGGGGGGGGSSGNSGGIGGGGFSGSRGDEEILSRNAVAAPLVAVSKVRLGMPRVKSFIPRNRAGLECHNSLKGDEPNKVICSQRGNILWTDYLPSPVLLMTGNAHFSAVACEDGGLYVYSPAGRRNVIQQKAILSSESIAPILHPAVLPSDSAQPSVSITSATVRQNGLPLLTTSAGHGYTYHEGMKSWVRVVDAWYATSSFFGVDPSTTIAAATATTGSGGGLMSPPLQQRKGVLAHLQAAAMGGRLDRDVGFAQELLHVDSTVQGAVTLRHLESQVAASQILHSPLEYKQWLRCYAQRLAEEGAQNRVEELCKFLMGPSYSGGENSGWVPTVLGIPKRELLRDILPILSSNRALQRVIKEYATALETLSPVSTGPNGAT